MLQEYLEIRKDCSTKENEEINNLAKMSLVDLEKLAQERNVDLAWKKYHNKLMRKTVLIFALKKSYSNQ